MNVKKWIASVLAVATMASLTACGGGSNGGNTPSAQPSDSASPSASEAVSGGVATYAMAGGWETLTPGYWCSAGAYGTMVWAQIYDKLVNVSPEGYTPRGALSWSINEDKTVMTFKLDPEAKFSDGEPVTAHDWEFSARLLATADFGAPDYTKLCVLFAGTDDTGLIDESSEPFGVKAVDDETLEITFKEAMTFDTFFNSYQMYLFVLPQHCFEGMSAAEIAASDFWNDPVCSGPWTVESSVVNSSLTLVPNQYYHLGVPKLDKLIITVMDSSNFASALMSGTIDYCYPAVSSTEAEALETVGGVEIVTSANPDTFWFFCVSNQKVSDAKVRTAINMAIDKQLIADQLFAGGATPVESVELYGSYLYNNDLTTNYDPEGAKALLDEAGWDYSYTLKIATPAGVRAQIATIIEQELEAIGMDVQVDQLDIGTMYAEMHAGNYDGIMGGGMPSLDPLYFQSNLEYTNQSTSIIKTDDPTYHELAQKISTAATDEEKLTYVMEYQQYMHDQMVTIPVVAVYSHMAYTSRLGGINPNMSAYYNDNTWEWFVQD